MTLAALPDPVLQSEFYADTPTKRLFAWIIDMILISVLCVALLPFTAFTGIFFFPFLILVIGFMYRVVTLANGSATIGMRLLAIEFRTADGSKFNLGNAFLHTLGYSVSMAAPLLQLISVVLMLTTERKKGLTDLLMGTVVINRPARY